MEFLTSEPPDNVICNMSVFFFFRVWRIYYHFYYLMFYTVLRVIYGIFIYLFANIINDIY